MLPAVEIATRSDPGPLPRSMGRYTLLAPIGSGSSAEVFLALEGAAGFERTCVVKRARPDLRDDAYARRFLEEARALSTSPHGAVAHVLDAGRFPDGVPYLAMEHVEGRDLSRILDAAAAAGRRIPVEVALHVAAIVLDGLAHAWTRRDREGAPLRMLHGGFGPRSVVCSWDGQVKVVDLGLAHAEVLRRAAKSGAVQGGATYGAPEALRGEAVDARADVFSVGMVLWELLSTARLVPGDHTAHLAEVASGRFLPPPLAGRVPRVPPDVDRVLARALAARPDDRPRDPASMRNEVAEVLHRLSPGTGATHVASLLEGIFPGEREKDRSALAALAAAGKAHAAQAAGDAIIAAASAPLGGGAGLVPGTRYRIVSKIGEGGAGTVYDAVHVDLERPVALKVLHAAASANPEFVERFRQEARAVARLGHENIIAASDFGQTADGRVFFAMERLVGESLGERLGKVGVLPVGEALRITLQVLRGLAAAHAVGLVHRDVKPENVFLRDDHKVKLLDFGIAKALGPVAEGPKLTRDGIAIGTPEYMAPEQAAAREVDARTDLYAVGVMLYEMITGSLPFDAEAVPKLLVMHMEDVPERPSVRAPALAIPEDVEAIVMRALEKAPEMRFPSALAMAQEVDESLRALATPDAVEAVVPPSRSEKTRPDLPASLADAARREAAPRRSRAPQIVIALAGLAVVAGGAVLALRGEDLPAVPIPARAPPEPHRAAQTSAAPAPPPVPATAVARVDPPASATAATAAPHPDDAIDVHLRRAERALRDGDLARARREVAWVLERDDDNRRATRLLEQISAAGP